MVKSTIFQCKYYFVDEGSIYEVPIQVGDDKFENNVTLRIRIFNENGDFWTFMTVFQVRFKHKPKNTLKKHIHFKCETFFFLNPEY